MSKKHNVLGVIKELGEENNRGDMRIQREQHNVQCIDSLCIKKFWEMKLTYIFFYLPVQAPVLIKRNNSLMIHRLGGG